MNILNCRDTQWRSRKQTAKITRIKPLKVLKCLRCLDSQRQSAGTWEACLCCWCLILCILELIETRNPDLWQDSPYASSNLNYWKHALVPSHVRIIHAENLILFFFPATLLKISLQVGSKQAAVLWKQLVSETTRNPRAQMVRCIALFISLVSGGGGSFREPSRTNQLCNRWSQIEESGDFL